MKKRNDFTMIEMVVVVLLIALLAAIATPMYFGYLKDARVTAAKSQLDLFQQAITDYSLKMGGRGKQFFPFRKRFVVRHTVSISDSVARMDLSSVRCRCAGFLRSAHCRFQKHSAIHASLPICRDR